MAQKTVVVNIRHEQYDQYCGRAGKGQKGTFGNPYGQYSREENIKLFKEYFCRRLETDSEFALNVLQLQGLRLGCFCHDENGVGKPCHCDVIAEYLNNLSSEALLLAVVGHRSFTNYEYVKEVLQQFNIKQIISGGARGADALAKKYAIEHDIKYKEFPAEWDKYGKAAGPIRNKKIVDAADEIVAFLSDESKGTANTIKIAKEQGKPVHIFNI